jgi:hypothetical protein
MNGGGRLTIAGAREKVRHELNAKNAPHACLHPLLSHITHYRVGCECYEEGKTRDIQSFWSKASQQSRERIDLYDAIQHTPGRNEQPDGVAAKPKPSELT